MPKLDTLALTTGQSPAKTYTFVPSSNRNNRAVLVDITTETRVVDQQVISAEITTPTGTSGRSRFRGTLKFPIPVEDQSGCCVDKDAPTAVYANVDVQVSTAASTAQITDSLELFRAWVASDDFAALFAGQAYY